MRRAVILTLALAEFGSTLAHADLENSTPTAGEVLEAAPAEVSLTFTEAAEVRFSTFKVYPLGADLGSADLSTNSAEARLNGLAGQLVSEVLETQGDDDARADTGVSTPERTTETVTLPLKPALGAGVYVVMWRVLSVDSHTSQGFVTFRVLP